MKGHARHSKWPTHNRELVKPHTKRYLPQEFKERPARLHDDKPGDVTHTIFLYAERLKAGYSDQFNLHYDKPGFCEKVIGQLKYRIDRVEDKDDF